MQAIERGVPVKNCMYEAYSKSHIKPDGTFTDLKSANIHSRILDYVEEQRLEGQEVTLNEAYLHVVKPDQKNRMFGADDLAKEIANDLFDGTSSQFHSEAACQDRYSQMEQQLQEGREERQRLGEQTRQLQEALKTQQQLIEKIMSQQTSDSGHPPLP